MNRRGYLASVSSVLLAGVTGCSGFKNDKKAIDPDNFELDTVMISKNAPNKVGVTITASTNKFIAQSVGVEVKILDENEKVLFHEPAFEIRFGGDKRVTESYWFKSASFEQLTEPLVPKARILSTPPGKT